MIDILHWTTLISMLLMTLLILVQTRGASLGAGLGGGGEVHTVRRGTDKSVHQVTIVTATIFAVSLILGVVVA